MIYKYTIPLPPVTKKNSQRILVNRKTGMPFIAPSSAYKRYEEQAIYFLTPKPKTPLAGRYNVKLLFYMPTRRKVDKTNLESAIMDVLVDSKILADDNRNIVAATDGTRVYYDKENPRTEIYIEDFTEEYDTWGKGLT